MRCSSSASPDACATVRISPSTASARLKSPWRAASSTSARSTGLTSRGSASPIALASDSLARAAAILIHGSEHLTGRDSCANLLAESARAVRSFDDRIAELFGAG